jgi:hypothetical protein
MTDARSKLDILYQDVLGDVGDLVERVEALKSDLPAAFDEAAGRLQGEVVNLLSAVRLIEQKITEQAGLIDSHANDAAKSAAEGVKLDVRASVKESMHQIAQDVLTTEILEAKGKVSVEIARLEAVTTNAVNRIQQAQELLRQERMANLFICGAASFFGYGLFFIFQKLVLH